MTPGERGERKEMKHFESTCEVWVKPLFRKSRPKTITTAWTAHDYEEFLWLLRNNMQGKRWTLLSWRELELRP